MTKEEKAQRIVELEKEIRFDGARMIDIKSESSLLLTRMTELQDEADALYGRVKAKTKELKQLAKELDK